MGGCAHRKEKGPARRPAARRGAGTRQRDPPPRRGDPSANDLASALRANSSRSHRVNGRLGADRLCRSLHLAAAKQAGGRMAYLAGLLAALHFADHTRQPARPAGRADPQRQHGGGHDRWARRASPHRARRQRRCADAMAKVFAEAPVSRSMRSLLSASARESWAAALGELKLPGVAPDRTSDWLQRGGLLGRSTPPARAARCAAHRALNCCCSMRARCSAHVQPGHRRCRTCLQPAWCRRTTPRLAPGAERASASCSTGGAASRPPTAGCQSAYAWRWQAASSPQRAEPGRLGGQRLGGRLQRASRGRCWCVGTQPPQQAAHAHFKHEIEPGPLHFEARTLQGQLVDSLGNDAEGSFGQFV